MSLVVPDYTPLNRYMHREFESATLLPLRDDGIGKAVDAQLEAGFDGACQYVEHYYQNDFNEIDAAVFENYLEMATKALEAKYTLSMYEKAIHQARRVLKEDIKNNPEFLLDNLDYFSQENKKGVYKNCKIAYDSLHRSGDKGLSKFLNDDPYYEMFKYAKFIVLNPESVLPTENNDDDLDISGGKISLKDAVSLKEFSNPRRSIKCGHTFDQEIVNSQFSNHGNDCPVPGCEEQLRKADFVPDILMKFRVRVAQEIAKKTKRLRSLDREPGVDEARG